jgi:hypothetical protein
MPRKEIDYSKTVIYKIVCNDLAITDLYVGSTTNFTRRKSQHRERCKKLFNIKIYQIIKDNGGWENWSMLQIEEFPCVSGNEARARERHWYEQLNANLNTICPFREDSNDYYQENKELILARNKIYYDANKEQIIKVNKTYYNKNKEKLAECDKKRYMLKRDDILAQKVEYYKTNKEKIDNYKKEYFEKNKEHIREKAKAYYAKNKESILAKKKQSRESKIPTK